MTSRRQLLFALIVCGGCRPPGVAAPVMKTTHQNPRCAISSIAKSASRAIEIAVSGSVEFPVHNELPSLRIGNFESQLSRYPDSGDTHHLIFSVEPVDFAALPDGAQVLLYYGDPSDVRRWDCGRLDKRMFR